jgi:hypothetical protein
MRAGNTHTYIQRGPHLRDPLFIPLYLGYHHPPPPPLPRLLVSITFHLPRRPRSPSSPPNISRSARTPLKHRRSAPAAAAFSRSPGHLAYSRPASIIIAPTCARGASVSSDHPPAFLPPRFLHLASPSSSSVFEIAPLAYLHLSLVLSPLNIPLFSSSTPHQGIHHPAASPPRAYSPTMDTKLSSSSSSSSSLNRAATSQQQPHNSSASQPQPHLQLQSQNQQQLPQQHQQPPPPPPPRADAASPFLRDFNLVAEAAKRAQMAILMRDLEAVGI